MIEIDDINAPCVRVLEVMSQVACFPCHVGPKCGGRFVLKTIY